MKNLKSKIILSNAILTACFLSSCESEELDLDRGNFAEDSADDTNSFLTINYESLSEHQKNNIGLLRSFANDLYASPIVAQAYYNSPKEVLSLYNLSEYNLSMDDISSRILLSFGDPDVKLAIYNKDLSSYLSVMQNKGFLTNDETKSMQTYITTRDSNSAVVALVVALLGVAVGAYIVVVVDVGFWGATCSSPYSLMERTIEYNEPLNIDIKSTNSNTTYYDEDMRKIQESVDKLSIDKLKKEELIKIAFSIQTRASDYCVE